MLFLFLYIVAMLIIMGLAIVLNWKYEWINKDWIANHDIEFAMLALCFIFWPAGIVVAIVAGVFTLIHNFLIPD